MGALALYSSEIMFVLIMKVEGLKEKWNKGERIECGRKRAKIRDNNREINTHPGIKIMEFSSHWQKFPVMMYD